MTRFELTDEETQKANEWMDQQDNIVRKKQGLSEDEPIYYGSIGGAVTFSFTPTSLGVIVKVRNSVTNNEIDLTDYHSW
jgi:hypothetical protein